MLIVSDKTIHMAFWTRTTYKQNPINPINSINKNPWEKFFIFTIYQNYTLALIILTLPLTQILTWPLP